MEELLAWINKFFKKQHKDEFITANEAYIRALNMKKQGREAFKSQLLRRVKKEINTSSLFGDLCYVSNFSDLQSKEVLPEIAEYFIGRGYDVVLLNGDNYSETNILIVNWQNQQIFIEEEVTE